MTATNVQSCWTVVPTPIGPLLLVATDAGLATVGFHADERLVGRTLARLTARFGAEPKALPEPPGPRPAPEAGQGPAPGPGPAPASGPGAGPVSGPGVLRATAAELAAYFAGEVRGFGIPLDWRLTGGFNARVLHALAETVPYGGVATYQDLAEAVGEPGAARAVGMAMGANPLPVVVPCHRVVASGGGLGGFGGGLEAKRSLLALEGVLPAPLF
ncbi:methylated-DNA--[protein]-cysteine S-methyltransferase [Streptomyces sp. WMMC897]|uniref:methylated-DNA--[protein]-cysteine S-methyltransferase n=1 Tax=Streptomyces sp. WMMC897 TaxID=3014782 RepID=UPI0022B63C50|nr:methylated-DNA--[protein]-cysteine S-methyltransferase [Streptomyces sp. WMMC897]MCZ7413649.1 methylated-DNA--[protein]-cysteine S-methyltransferase [Streptomyces sp. WMMC897]